MAAEAVNIIVLVIVEQKHTAVIVVAVAVVE